MGEKGGRIENLKSFVKGKDSRRCAHPSGRPKNSRELRTILYDILELDPEILLTGSDPRTIELVQNFKRLKLIKDSKDLIGLRWTILAIKGNKHALDMILSQIGEDKPTKIDLNITNNLDDLTDEQLEAIIRGDATFQDFVNGSIDAESESDFDVEESEEY